MTLPPASVIVVSRHRPAELRLCLLALTQQDHPNFEVIVVADPLGIAVAQEFGLRCVPFDEANISAARNAGLAQAGGSVVAFIDDDAVAEPTWLTRLVAPFDDAAVMAATGFVRGRNGISRQWGAAWVDRFGTDHPFDIGDAGGVFDALPDRAIKTQGTNCAFRRAAVLAAGGFDPAYRFYHDETDLNLRMKARTAVVPMAQVVHGFAQSARRRADRVPSSLEEVAASSAVFLRRHAPDADLAAERDSLRALAMNGLAGHVSAGRLGTTDVGTLLQGFDRGWSEGLARKLEDLAPIPLPKAAFQPLPARAGRAGLVLGTRFRIGARCRRAAVSAVAAGQIVTVFCFSWTARPHRLRFTEDGFWLQEGGLFGRSDRVGPAFRLVRFGARVKEETARAAKTRPVG